MTIPVLPTSYFSLILGCTAPNNGYYGYWTPTSGGVLEIYTLIAGVFGAPKASTAGSITAGQTFGFKRAGRTLTLMVDNVDVLSWVDTNDTFLSGYPGFGIEDTTARGDNFTATFDDSGDMSLLSRRRRL